MKKIKERKINKEEADPLSSHSILYRTHHLFNLSFFLCGHTTAPNPLLFRLCFRVEMNCVEGALKSSFRKQMGLKTSAQQALLDDLWVANNQNVASCDDFFVDDLLDLSNDDAFVEKETDREDKPETKKPPSVSPKKEQDEDEEEKNINFSQKEGFGTAELSVPAEDLANLEWLSHFVDESYSTTPFVSEKPMMMIEVVQAKESESRLQSPVPAKARSKRCRSGGRVWSLSLTDSSSSSTTDSSSCSSQSSPWLVYPNREWAGKMKKAKARVEKEARRCSHCGVQKTPQWRTGPHGAKTLCNACGVRFKSGRLLPEYRPACSPTFSRDLHSNHHRKVLEMRRKKDLGHQVVSSF